jgi:predicted nucleotidyltransferase component of viral defense system
MIPSNDIVKWAIDHQWPTRDQVEQDLLLSQAMCEISNDDLLGQELVLRGGTSFHKLFLPQPLRYSEDLDYVRVSEGGIGDVMKSLTALGNELGYKVNTKMGIYPKVFWKSTAESGLPLKIKIEINTFERSPSLPLITVYHEIDTTWCQTSADVQVFQVEELVATKIRALYQRSKGRDLFDFWLALDLLALDSEKIIGAFEPYRPEKTSSIQMINNLEAKLEDRAFLEDLNSLVVRNDLKYEPNVAGRLIIDKVISRL